MIKILTVFMVFYFSPSIIDEVVASSVPSREEEPTSKKLHIGQIYGIATYDALFKYVLSQDSIRPSFFHAFVPWLTITSSRRLDEHMNPLQELQLLRDFIHRRDTAQAVDRISDSPDICLGSLSPGTTDFVKDEAATTFLHEMIGHFDDIKKAFPRARYDGTMDFVCMLNDGDYAMVEMQVIPQDYWDRRALAYVAAFYGNQLRKGDKWEHHIKKVIGINILGGGKDDKVHWRDTPGEYIRHYKFQEQLNDTSRYIDGIELIQYSIMNAPAVEADREKRDWITFFKRGHHMTEAQVKEQIQTPGVLEAFEKAKLLSLPEDVKAAYDDEDKRYDRYSQHTQELVEKGKEEAKREMAKGLLEDGVDIKIVSKRTGLPEAELERLKNEP